MNPSELTDARLRELRERYRRTDLTMVDALDALIATREELTETMDYIEHDGACDIPEAYCGGCQVYATASAVLPKKDL